MAERELKEIKNHGLSARIPTREQMRKEAKAWNDRRNKEACKINRRFTTADARIKLKRLYPQFESCRDTSDENLDETKANRHPVITQQNQITTLPPKK
jgi:hypothetical protein